MNKVITFSPLKSNQQQNYTVNSNYVQSNELIFEVKVSSDFPLSSMFFAVANTQNSQLLIGVFPFSDGRSHLQ